MVDLTTFQLLKDSFSTLREAIGLAKDAKSLLPGPQQNAVMASLEQAGKAAVLAEAEIAKALGYKLHKCTFPPQIMLAVATAYGEESQCPLCRFTTSFYAPLQRPGRAATDYDPLA